MSHFSHENWASEKLTAHTELRTQLGAELARVQSCFQLITVHETEDFGRLLRLDGCNMTSERDEFCYHEPMVHPALLAQAAPRNVLILGGGDGGAAKEALKHACVERVTIAELDAEVVRVSKALLPRVHQGAFDDARLDVRIGDGMDYVRECNEHFDLIVMDLTDPDENAGAFYCESFFRLARTRLTPNGVLTLHLGSPFFHAARVTHLLAALRAVFAHVSPLSAFVPIYGAQWQMACASAGTDVVATLSNVAHERAHARRIGALQLYQPAQHCALFSRESAARV